MGEVRENDMGFAWEEWESEFRGVVGEMTDEEWGNLDDSLARMEEQEEMCIRDRGREYIFFYKGKSV